MAGHLLQGLTLGAGHSRRRRARAACPQGVRQEAPGALYAAAVEQILAGYKARPRPTRGSGTATLCVPIGDTQAGKISPSGGTPELVERFGRVVDEVRERIETEFGGRLAHLILAWTGDLIESYASAGGKLPLDSDVTASMRLMRRLILHALGVLAPLADKVTVPTCPGNHDRIRNDRITSPTDSYAIDIVSQVQDALSFDRARFGHVEFRYPDDGEPWVVLNAGSDEAPLVIGFSHGDLVNNPDRQPAWIAGQAMGRGQIGMCDVVVTSHFHHLQVRSVGGRRTWIQTPAMDSGSDQFRHRRGDDSVSGVISFELTPGTEPGWRGLVLHA